MRHPTTVPITDILRAYLELVGDDDDQEALLEAEIDVRMRAQAGAGEARLEGDVAGELCYGRWVPFELVPFAWQGGDALHYGHLVMAEELGEQDWPAGSFAPQELTVSWLGDDTREALQNLLATTAAFPQVPWSREEKALHERVVGALELAPGEVLRLGARSERRLTPRVPPGYRHVVGRTGVGVLARADAFGDVDPAAVPFEIIEERAEELLASGSPASALLLLQLQRAEADRAGERDACERMVRVYRALGRPTMAARVEHHLRTSIFD